MLENCRLNKGEKKNDEALARKMAALCDIFVHDAFGTAHRAEASDLRHRAVREGGLRRPAARRRDRRDHQGARATRGGRWWRSSPAARSSTKLTILQSLAKNVDQLIVGGGIANTFMLAAGLPIGKSLAEPDLLERGEGGDRGDEGARRRRADSRVDVVTAKAFKADAAADRQGVARRGGRRPDPRHRPEDRARAGRAAGEGAGTIVWNGPVGVFEFDAFARRHRDDRAGDRRRPSAFSIAGGGDTLAAIAKYGIEKTSATSRPAAARSSRCWKARPCRPSRSCRSARAGIRVMPTRAAPATARRCADSIIRIVPNRTSTHGDRPMPRATKIVATLGPASSSPEVLEQMIRAGVDVVRLNFSHGKAQDHIDRADAGARGRAAGPARRWRSWPTCRARRSASASSTAARRCWRPGRPSSSTPRCTELGNERARRPGLQGTAARRAPGRHAAAQRRPAQADRRRGARRAGAHHGRRRRRAVEQQGHQQGRRRPDRAGADRQGHGGHQDRDELPGRVPGGELPEERDRHGDGAPARQRGRRAVAATSRR